MLFTSGHNMCYLYDLQKRKEWMHEKQISNQMMMMMMMIMVTLYFKVSLLHITCTYYYNTNKLR